VFDHDGEIELEVDNEYIMSPKDLKTIDFLDRILAAGVTVLKIEGRGRGPEYVKTVTRCYREAIDAIQQGAYTAEKIEHWTEQLRTVYNRGFWEGYYLGRKLGEWSEKYGSQATRKKVYVGQVTNYFTKLKVAEIKLETQDLSVGDEIHIIGPTTGVVEETIREIRYDLNPVQQVRKGDVCSIPVDTFLRRSDKVYRIDK
jgi:putative protease